MNVRSLTRRSLWQNFHGLVRINKTRFNVRNSVEKKIFAENSSRWICKKYLIYKLLVWSDKTLLIAQRCLIDLVRIHSLGKICFIKKYLVAVSELITEEDRRPLICLQAEYQDIVDSLRSFKERMRLDYDGMGEPFQLFLVMELLWFPRARSWSNNHSIIWRVSNVPLVK